MKMDNYRLKNSDASASGGLKLLSGYSVEQCTPEIQSMVHSRLIPISDVEVLEEIGKGRWLSDRVIFVQLAPLALGC